MSTIYIYGAFDDQPSELIDQHECADNDECESWAAENYGDTDQYAWSYTAYDL